MPKCTQDAALVNWGYFTMLTNAKLVVNLT